jgi:hypothetical protein
MTWDFPASPAMPEIDPAAEVWPILELAEKHSGVSIGEILSERRDARTAEVRAIAQYVARHVTGLSWPQLGVAFRRHHTTILVACRRVETSYRLRRIADDLARRTGIDLEGSRALSAPSPLGGIETPATREPASPGDGWAWEAAA